MNLKKKKLTANELYVENTLWAHIYTRLHEALHISVFKEAVQAMHMPIFEAIHQVNSDIFIDPINSKIKKYEFKK